MITFFSKWGSKATLAVAALLSFSSAKADVTTFVEADFSVLTAGSEEAPALFDSNYGLYYANRNAFSMDWIVVANKTGQAGGSLYIADGGTLRTPYFDGVTTTGGAVKVTVEVKLNNADAGIVQMVYGSTTASSSNTYQTIIEGTDWQTVEFLVTPTYTSKYSNYAVISPYLLADGIFVKSIKAEQSPDFLGAPVASQPSKADGESFTATWRAVTGATKYFIDVYHYGSEGQKVYKLENEEVTGTSYEVTGLVPGFVYYYVVRAGNDNGGVSSNSNEIEVVKVISSLGQPEVFIKEVDEDGTFTAVWAGVADADGYSVVVLKKGELAEDGLASVLEETFDVFTTGSISSVTYIYERHLVDLGEPGWTGDELCCINGGIGIAPYSGSGFLATPALDLSADDGNVTVVLNAAYTYAGAFSTGGTVTLCLVDADGNETEPVEVTFDQAGFADYTVELTGGTAQSKVKIEYTPTSSLYKMFIDNIQVQQVMPAGTAVTTTYITDETEATEYTGQVEFAADTEYTLVVTALGRTVSGGQITAISSDPSEAVAIEFKSSGVENVATDSAKATIKAVAAGTIEVSVATATTVEVFDLTGRKVAAANVGEGTTTLAVDAKGIVIVKAGDTTAKLTL